MIIRRNTVTEEEIMNHLRLVGHVVMYVENIGYLNVWLNYERRVRRENPTTN